MKKTELTRERLKELLDYDPETGVFRWRVSRGNKIPAGSLAGCLGGDRYWHICIDYKIYAAHRLIWLYHKGVWPKDQIDHINGDRLDNRVVNLREANNQQNHMNIGITRANTSGVRGVSQDRPGGKWRAQIVVQGRQRLLGYFQLKEEAKAAYDAMAEKHFGEFRRVV